MRFWLMAEAFRKAGHKVVYWTSEFSHANKKKRVLDPGVEAPFDIELIETEPYFKNVSLRRLKSHRKLAKTFLKVAREAIRNGRCKAPDLIIASSPPLGLVDASHTIASETGAKVIVDIMDAWPETFERVVPRFLLWPLRRLARRNYLRAAAITTVADNYVELARSYGFSKDIRRFYHGITKGDSPRFPQGDSPRTPTKGDSPHPPFPVPRSPHPSTGTVPLRIVYAGNMGRSYDLVTAVEAVGELGALATLDIAGKGEQEASLKALVEKKGIKGVRFHGYLSEAELEELLNDSDIGLVPMDPSSCVGIPYKLADYVKSSLAVVSSLGGESARLLKEYGAGVPYSFGDPASLVEAVESLRSRLAEMRRASSKMLDEQFDSCRIYDSYVDFAAHVFSK
jgi:glycosyltransferase involved in cell wall biosynthesis